MMAPDGVTFFYFLFYYLSVIHKCHIIADLLFTINDDNDTLRILIYWFKIPKSDLVHQVKLILQEA